MLTLEELVGRRKSCPRCGESKPDSAFYVVKGRAGRNGLSSWCRSCTASREATRRDARLAAELAAQAPDRRCCGCGDVKSLDQFSTKSWRCKPCANAYQGERRRVAPDRARNNTLKSRFHITLQQYNELLDQQGGCCALCGRPPKTVRLHVDHDHRCCPERGKSCGNCIRGLVCYPCNIKLSLFETDSDYSIRIRAYLGVKVMRDGIEYA
jgi:Recombination endonuclease VII